MSLKKSDPIWIVGSILIAVGIGIIATFPRQPQTVFVEVPAEPEIVYVEVPAEPEVVYVEVPAEPTYIELVPESEFMSYIGDFDLTAYCPCEKCCGEWGKNRPVINNQKVVNTASGAFAWEGVTVAVDPQVIPYGTKLYIEGVGVRVAQDCGGAIKGNRIDIYYLNHEDAWRSGVNDRPRKVWVINEEVDLSY